MNLFAMNLHLTYQEVRRIKKIMAIVACLVAALLAGCANEETKIYNSSGAGCCEGIECYYDDPNCKVICMDVGIEEITCVDNNGNRTLWFYGTRDDGPCGDLKRLDGD